MSKVIKLSFLLFLMILISCKSSKNILNEALASPNEKIQKVMQSPKEYELQIIYSKINRNKNNEVTFEDYTYNLDANAYFYPASTVKFPIALIKLEKLNTLPGASMENTFDPGKYFFNATGIQPLPVPISSIFNS